MTMLDDGRSEVTGKRDPDPEKGDEHRTSIVSLTVTRTTISLNQR